MLTKVQFAGIKSLLDVTLELAPFTVLVGPNGCGKTTVLDQIELLGAASRARMPAGPVLGAVGQMLLEMGPLNANTRGSTGAMRWVGEDQAGSRMSVTVVPDQVNDGSLGASLEARAASGKATIAAGKQNDKQWNDVVSPHFPWAAQRLALVPREVAAPSDVALTTLRPDGHGLPTILKDFASNHTKRYLKLQEDLAVVVPHFRELWLGKSTGQGQDARNGVIPLHTLEFEMSQGRIPAGQVSDGTLLALALLTVVHNPDLPKIVLMDDLDHGLHLGAQVRLVEAIRAVQKLRPELQVVCTTHSPVLLDSFDVSEVRVLALDAAGHTHVKPLSDHPRLDAWRTGFSAGELWANLGEDWVVDA